jgi:transaldolase
MTSLAFQVAGPTSDAADRIRAFCLRGHHAPEPQVRSSAPSSAFWRRFQDVGTQPWLDTGDLDAIQPRWTREMTALTTNNTLLNKEVQKGLYDELVPEAAALVREALPGASDDQVVLEIAFILNAVHALKLVRTFDADVSVELHTDASRDVEASVRFGRRFAAIEPNRFIVKVPLTPEGLVAARQLHEDGIRVNFTLGFSARQNLLIAQTARPTWVNVFLGRINSFVSEAGLGTGNNAGEKATLASQRMLRELRDAGGPTVHQIGASVRNGQQVLDLAGVDVLTIPTAAADQAIASAPALDSIRDHTGEDPDADARGCDVFWSIDDGFRKACTKLAAVPAAELTAERVLATLAEHGGQDVFPALDAAELVELRRAGKIPAHDRWADHVGRGTASWDGLLSVAALESFADDQSGLDARIRGLI